MAAKTIPAVGEVYTGDIPAVVKCLHVTFGTSSADPDVAIVDTSTTTEYELVGAMPANTMIFGVWTRVEEAFYAGAKIAIGSTASSDVSVYATSDLNDTVVSSEWLSTFVSSGFLVPPTSSKIMANIITAPASSDFEGVGLLHVLVQYAVIVD